MANKSIIIIGGPTASGKTALAIQLARHFHTEIISADSRQCYREMSIGVAKPSEEELQQAKHWFIDTHSIHDDVNAATFEQYALQKADEIFQRHDVAVMVGGTGLYIKAFSEGLDDMPPVDAALRQQLNETFEKNGLAWLQQQVAEQDPLYYSNGEIQNPQRMIRALEVKLQTGKSIREFQQQKTVVRPFNIVKLAIDLPKETLHQRIDHRVDMMMEAGLLNEVQSLHPHKHLNALRTVGYSELFDYLDEKISLEEAVLAIKKNTRYYAKRQMTWFRKDKSFQWFETGDATAVTAYSEAAVNPM
ncbi:tRNA (adenosine(37)-N6)-dimethylallyltransferase MiaA [Pseudoflavitalea sp. G-6-1-2]|uniref:tRNA (adenosine(37)-N6)-dimethylallyltransferase MiaA n=1 Tax=Pseudoflavitalea sp. G-6-1-2 TaxID=2728841 RepID=UPI00146A16A8|nr:tRNA (adenosine(37)-N6)-dimethylallyltransferase MiaA [Pseudoflavitalea sp. G-6-1-2]NML22530.1 tRNA (adenosine(37)-N6)-dimethylallyltransferase MiaA [Pseudoflavitalea sp. G-6-1-2]